MSKSKSAPLVLVRAADPAAIKRAEQSINRVLRDKALSKKERVMALEALRCIAQPQMSMTGCYLVGSTTQTQPKSAWREFFSLPKWMRRAA